MKIVTAAIIIQSGNILITRRKTGEKNSGYWEFPGGKVESNENEKNCLIRELKEELGVGSIIKNHFMNSLYKYEFGEIILSAYFAEIDSFEFKLTVHDKFEWVPIKNLLNYKLSPADIPIAEKLIEKFNNARNSE